MVKVVGEGQAFVAKRRFLQIYLFSYQKPALRLPRSTNQPLVNQYHLLTIAIHGGFQFVPVYTRSAELIFTELHNIISLREITHYRFDQTTIGAVYPEGSATGWPTGAPVR